MSHTNRNQNSENISTSSEQDKGVSQTHRVGHMPNQSSLMSD